MRIGLDARAAFLDPERGFGRVTRELARALLATAPGQVVLFVPHGAQVPDAWYPLAAEVVQLLRPRRGAFLADGPAWAWTLRRHPVDVLHLPAWGVPPWVPVPVVATFHDATPFRFPSPPRAWQRHRLRAAIRSLRRADLVHAVSGFSAEELVRVAPEVRAPVRVVHWGVGEPFTSAPEPLPPEHLLYVGGGEPHKNLTLLLEMMALPGAAGLPPLVVAGGAAGSSEVLRRIAEPPLTGRVTVAGHPDDGGLAGLYRRALALLVPSLNEGFGLPVLEAMACGCPVLASRAGALPEVVGDAGLLLPPEDAAAWLRELLALTADGKRRAGLSEGGRGRAAAHTWTACATAMLGLYRDAGPWRRYAGAR